MTRSLQPAGAATGSRGRSHLRLLAASLGLFSVAAQAIGLGEVTQQSELGRPLRIVIPAITGASEDLAPECVRVVSSTRDGEGVPEIVGARVALQRVGSASQIVITTPRPVNDPAVRVTLQAGCENQVRREYVLLLDPEPGIAANAAPSALPLSRAETLPASPEVAAPQDTGPVGSSDVAAVAAAAPAASAGSGQLPPARRQVAAGATVGVPGSPPPPHAAVAPPAAKPRPAPPPKAHAPKSAAALKSAQPPIPPLAALTAPQPRLSVSSAAPSPSALGKGGDAPPASTQEAANALEAETIVLRQRVAQLTELVDRMQLELRTAQAAQAARLAAEEAARNQSPSVMLARWFEGGWPILAALVILAALIAAGLAWRRRSAVPAAVWSAPSVSDMMATGESAAALAPAMPAAAEAPAQPEATPAAQPSTPSDVAVSELSHVTEEAGVYLAFNRIDRAIEVLREHIRTQPRSLPAAWLMLLDIYRDQGHEQEFRELADQYHRQFNAQAPQWAAAAAQAPEETGLEAFPHVLSQLIRVWGKPECRDLLELLLYDNRDGRRAGFSPAAYSDLLMLRQIADPNAAREDVQPGQGLRPAWAAASPGELPQFRAEASAAPAPAASPTPLPTLAPAPRPAAAEPAPAARVSVPAARDKRPASLDLEVAFDEDITGMMPAPAVRDGTGGSGSKGRA